MLPLRRTIGKKRRNNIRLEELRWKFHFLPPSSASCRKKAKIQHVSKALFEKQHTSQQNQLISFGDCPAPITFYHNKIRLLTSSTLTLLEIRLILKPSIVIIVIMKIINSINRYREGSNFLFFIFRYNTRWLFGSSDDYQDATLRCGGVAIRQFITISGYLTNFAPNARNASCTVSSIDANISMCCAKISRLTSTTSKSPP